MALEAPRSPSRVPGSPCRPGPDPRAPHRLVLVHIVPMSQRTTSARRLTLWGGVLLGVGLVLAFLSSHLADLVMGYANLGFAVFAPDPGSADWQHAVRLRFWSDVLLYGGLIVTAVGVFMQTRGALLARPREER